MPKIRLEHPFTITKFRVLTRYIRENRKDISRDAAAQIAFSGAVSFLTTPARLLETAIYSQRERKTPVERPLFVLGHWRSGTTLVQQLLARDPQYGFLDPLMNFTINFYHTLGWAFKNVIASNLDMGRPMDNMKYAMDLPLEEYIVFSTLYAHSVYALNFFPKAFARYSAMAYVDRMESAERAKWEKTYDRMLRKIASLNGGKPLMLKSPDNTARMLTLKRMYPDAKFVNIYRDPYTVIRSTVHLYEKMLPTWTVEELPDRDTLEDLVIDSFREMYETYFEEKARIGEKDLYEIRFEDFERDPLPILKEMYARLELPGYEQAAAGFERHWNAQADYKKNEFEFSGRLVRKVNERLGFYFEHYGYEMREA